VHDMHKWSLINKALDMGQPEPVETYSSSPHLYTDLDIPAGSKGRLKSTPAPKVETAASRPPRERREGDSAGASRPPRERREGDRQRTRTRGAGTGAVAAGSAAPATVGATDSIVTEGKPDGSGTHDGSTPARRRSRRRRPSGGSATPPPAA